MNQFFVGFLDVTTTSPIISFNGGLHWFDSLVNARAFYDSAPTPQGASNIIALGKFENRIHSIIECKPI